VKIFHQLHLESGQKRILISPGARNIPRTIYRYNFCLSMTENSLYVYKFTSNNNILYILSSQSALFICVWGIRGKCISIIKTNTCLKNDFIAVVLPFKIILFKILVHCGPVICCLYLSVCGICGL